MFLFFIQTAQQQEEGLYILLIMVVFLIGLAVWSKLDDKKKVDKIEDRYKNNVNYWAKYKQDVNVKIKQHQTDYYKKLMSEKKISWRDYHDLYQLRKYDLAKQVYDFLKKQEEDIIKNEAINFELDSKINLSDIRLKKKLEQIQKATCRCNYCNNDLMRIWRLCNNLIEIRCEDCKKKFMYKYSYFEKSNDNNVNLAELLDDISLFYKRLEAENKNPFIRKTELKLDYTGHKSNSPFTYPFVITPFLNAEDYKATGGKNNPEEKRTRRISQRVKDLVWNRDNGKCVECGSNENLEFDHIIPHSKGGANTYRNIQLLCEGCNRVKSDKIG